MEELYQIIEEKIKASGLPISIDGKAFYDEVSKEADEKENGAYIFMVKMNDAVYYEGQMEILDNEFDLHTVDFHVNDQVYHVDFDA